MGFSKESLIKKNKNNKRIPFLKEPESVILIDLLKRNTNLLFISTIIIFNTTQRKAMDKKTHAEQRKGGGDAQPGSTVQIDSTYSHANFVESFFFSFCILKKKKKEKENK